ncbi:MAG: 4-hydroxy-tetrahydrodipicolinate reductase [Betaproteobacteria bacterium]|nr:4-hydroxy-tetrahydrodipicolinate reductase [Betaproteobacteria bacterium]
MSRLQVAIAGAHGRMGRVLLEAVASDSAMSLAAALVRPGSMLAGQDAGQLIGSPCGVRLSHEVAGALSGADVLIDFTRPDATLAHLAACSQLGINAVVGTTGFSSEQKAEIARFAEKMAIVFAPNMSIGVNLTLKLVAEAAQALGLNYDIEVFEAHHKLKVDAPSGTALRLGEVAAHARGQRLSEVAVYSREGQTGARTPGSIGFSVLRAGDIIGDHTVYFAGPGERIEISHKSSSRDTYAQGALRAARFLADKKTGLFDMQDVLGLQGYM